MSTGGTLNIINHFPIPLTIYVSGDNFNCCDAPQPNQAVGYLQPNAEVDLGYARTDGHGCNGEQGYFQLLLNASMQVNLNFDSNGVMSAPGAVGCSAVLGTNNDLIVYPN